MTTDDGDLVRALADDLLAAAEQDDGPTDVDEVYEWLILRAAELDDIDEHTHAADLRDRQP